MVNKVVEWKEVSSKLCGKGLGWVGMLGFC